MTYLRLHETPNLGVHQTGSSSNVQRLRKKRIDSENALIATPLAQDRIVRSRHGQMYLVGHHGRCVRGIPLGAAIWRPGDGPAGEPAVAANDNTKGGRWPLQEEYKAKRLGKQDEEGDLLWVTAKWFAGHYDLANRPVEATYYGLDRQVKSGELGGFVDRDDRKSKGSTDPFGYQIEMAPLQEFNTVSPDGIESYNPLLPAENMARSAKICQHLKYRLDCNYRHLVDAVVNRFEMKAIGMAEGSKDGAATAGRMLVRAGLRTATLVRSDIARWESKDSLGALHIISPLPNKPDVYTAAMRQAANDDVRQHVRNVA